MTGAMTVLTRVRELGNAVFMPHAHADDGPGSRSDGDGKHEHNGRHSNGNGNGGAGKRAERNGAVTNGKKPRTSDKAADATAGNGAAAPSLTVSDLVRATIAKAEPVRDLDHDELELDVVAVRLGSVAKVTAFFGLASAIVWTIAIAAGWVVASSLGLTHSFQSFIRDIGFEGFKLDARPVFLAVGLIGLSWIVVLVVLAVVAAAAYNVFASQFGGMRCVVTSRGPGSIVAPAHAPDGSAAAQVAEPARNGATFTD
jgi:hypothetical protein